ncbi:hypothetical protein HB364_11775 [Pseudoflavitalea sp. X16]|uniref:hypothetical protein n=1 Tax=Paraflavitalea devenefica TaxID=2716334 RepID=UPI001421637B|nr:hypothetical protein [Paraflavitalea devenefica]NII25766.1 hypothetical protein [Paraflavitalea devenefica]
MAKQKGTHRFTGKMGATIGYKLKDEFIERENGSKEGKAFKKDPLRWRTMYYAGLFVQASQTVKFIYRALPEDQQQHGVYGKLSGMAFTMIKAGKTVEEVKEVLTKQYVEDKRPLVEEKQEEEAAKTTGTAASGAGAGTAPAPLPVLENQVQSYVIARTAMPVFYTTVSG